MRHNGHTAMCDSISSVGWRTVSMATSLTTFSAVKSNMENFRDDLKWFEMLRLLVQQRLQGIEGSFFAVTHFLAESH